ncbi:MAG: hypothetical protein HC780_29235 [Leptolyngbyaceae cyanobacterium CSU_1_3]|nr:hypothetical protein [Leptolyngbyaceae cyanobacterium CSU_1_3]
MGCLLLAVLASILVFCIFWLRSPANANERWNIKDTWVSTTSTGGTIRFLSASLIPNGTIVVHTTADTRFHRAEDFSLIQTMPIQTGNLSISPDGSLMAAQPQSASGKGVVSIYRTIMVS